MPNKDYALTAEELATDNVDQVLWNQNFSEPLDGGPIVEKKLIPSL